MLRLNSIGVPFVIAVVSALSACGGDGGSSAGGLPPPADTVTISGRVSGMVGSLVLQNNTTDILAVNSNGAFVFPTPVPRFGRYSINVSTQPPGQTCAVTNHSGVVTEDIDFVRVDCTNNAYTVGGTVSGLNGSLVLQTNGGADLAVNSNGAFTFGTGISHGSAYAVTVLTQPAGQICTVANGTGNALANINGVSVTCADIVVAVSSATTWSAPGSLAATLVVAPLTGLPSGESCLTHGTIVSRDGGSAPMTLSCTPNVTDPITGAYTVAGTNDSITFYANGVYVYATKGGDSACGHGVEAGVYNFHQPSGSFAVLSNAVDATGDCGWWRKASGVSGRLTATGGSPQSGFTFSSAAGESSQVLVPMLKEAL